MDSASLPNYPALTEGADCEVCIIGAGIAGLTTAYLLALEGRRVIVIDDGQIGSFDALGKVFTGPAISSLAKVDADGKPSVGA